MARVGDSAGLSDRVLRDAARWYAENRVPKAFRDVNPLILKAVQRISRGDWQRCVVDNDGSVVVHNTHVWTPTTE